MANGVFTFSPGFKEFLPSYRYVSRVWIGDGKNTGTTGVLYAEYEDGSVAELGSVSLYATAVQAGFTGTEEEWVQTIIGVADLDKRGQSTVKYMISDSGVEHPAEDSLSWSDTPSFQKGKFTWAKITLTWIDGTKTTFYSSAYQGLDGDVASVNGQTGVVNLHGENLPIEDGSETVIKSYIDNKVQETVEYSDGKDQDLKDYVDENDRILKEYVDGTIGYETATHEDIDSLFSMVFFNGAIFIHGREFTEGDEVTLQIEAVTPDAPLPLEHEVIVQPTSGRSWRYAFGPLSFKMTDIPEGEERITYTYRVSEVTTDIPGTTPTGTTYTTSMTLIDNGDGTMRLERAENWNALHFSYEYVAAGTITFAGNMSLVGRRMAAREFTVKLMEGNTVLDENISTTLEAESGVAVPIAFPRLVYTLADVGQHTYTVRQTSPSTNGVTIDNLVYTITVNVTDNVRDGELEIEASENCNQLHFTNTYSASGTVVISGTTTIVNRRLVAGDSYELAITGSGRLPSPSTLNPTIVEGETTIPFSFNAINYTLADMLDDETYLTERTFTYAVTENALLPGTSDDDLTHSVTIKVTDDWRGHLTAEVFYSDGNALAFTDTYAASGSIVLTGTKTLQNRKFVASDRMSVTLSALNGGRLPSPSTVPVTLTVGQNTADFSLPAINYVLADLEGLETKTFSYVVTEVATISGAANDEGYHTVDVQVTDQWDGTFSIVPTYVDGQKVKFVSVYDATGYLNITGTKTIVNRKFGSSDTMSVELAATNGGNLPNVTTVPVTLSTSQNTANFSFNRIAYRAQDLNYEDNATFTYTVTETANMPGTTTNSTVENISVLVTDMKNGTLNVTPTYANGNGVSFTNVYSAEGTLSFKAKAVFTNGNLQRVPTIVTITQVTGNGSTTAASSSVVLPSSVSMTANTGAEQTLSFNNIVTFRKNSDRDDTTASYWFMLETTTPALDANNISDNILYGSTRKWINVTVTDNGLGQLVVAKTPAADSNGLDAIFTKEQLSDLTVSAVWSGDDSLLTVSQKNMVSYTVSGPNSFSEGFTYAEMLNGAKTLEHLHLGSYTVTQSTLSFDGFEVDVEYAVGSSKTNVVALSDHTTKTIIISNAVTQKRGDLVLIQAWRGDTANLSAAYKNAITYTVTGPNSYAQTLSYADFESDSYTLYQLRPGTYSVTVSQTALENYDVTTSYRVGQDTTNNVNLTYHGSIIDITNNYNKLEGSLTVSAQWTGDHFRLTQAQKNGVTFTVTGPKQNEADTATYTNAFTYAEMTNGVKTITGLTLGTYTVVETNNSFENYTITPSYSDGSISTNTVRLYDGDNKTITVTTDVNKLEGSLTVAKVWTGDELTSQQKDLASFTVTGPKQISTDATTYQYTFTYADMDNGNMVIDRLTPGQYTVTETSENIEGDAEIATTYQVGGNATNVVALADGDSQTIIVTNNVTNSEPENTP